LVDAGDGEYVTGTEGFRVPNKYVAAVWADDGPEPHRRGTSKISEDPGFAAEAADVVGLYLQPPGEAVVLRVDEKTQIQALDRTQPVLPVAFDAIEQRPHDYVRHGVTSLFAAPDVETGEVTGDCRPTRDGAEFLAFPETVVAARPHRDAHVAPGDLSTHETPDVTAWLTANPRVRFHFTPVGSSWLNQIETWFGVAERQAIHRGTSSSVNSLIHTIRHYVDHWNRDAKPFTRTATADETLVKAQLVQASIKKLVDNNDGQTRQTREALAPRRPGGRPLREAAIGDRQRPQAPRCTIKIEEQASGASTCPCTQNRARSTASVAQLRSSPPGNCIAASAAADASTTSAHPGCAI
jgi:transposase